MNKVIRGGLLAAGLAVLFLSPLTSRLPDGLEKVAADQHFEHKASAAFFSAPLAGYAIPLARPGRLSTVFAGLAGVSATFILVVAAGRVLRARRKV